jgi:hypothetical protein
VEQYSCRNQALSISIEVGALRFCADRIGNKEIQDGPAVSLRLVFGLTIRQFRIEAGAAKILIDPFLSDSLSLGQGWSSYLAGKNSTHGGDR